jgi:glycosyltransferase involved in cell wall biosynthesis
VRADNTDIQLDAGALRFGASGIHRYFRSILSVWAAQGVHSMRLADTPASHLRRLASSLVGDSVAALRDPPAVYWGPAHRLPLLLPARTRSVVTLHDLCWKFAPDTMRPATRALDRVLMGHAVRRSSRIIAVSASTARDVVAQWPEYESKLRVIPLASSLPIGDELPWSGAPVGSGGYFLFVGTWEPRKNLHRLLEAYAQALKSDAQFPDLIICGKPGWGRVDPHAQAQRLGIRQRVHLISNVSDPVLATLYRHAVALVMPSLYEGFGLPLIEAIAQGCPVLTSHSASMPEVAGDAGLLVDAGSVASIAEGLRRLAFDPELRASLARCARVRAGEFTWEKTAEATWQVLLEAAREP